jgi:hypothetical protein
MARVLLGGLVAGIIVFMWGFVSHTALPLGSAGIKVLPNESAVMMVLKGTIDQPGVYLFPGLDPDAPPDEQQQAAWRKAYLAGPNGFLAYQPVGRDPFSPMLMITELASNILGGLLAAFIVYHVAANALVRVQIVMLMGLFAWISISVSHWSWYRFPTAFFVAEGIDQVVGWFLAGLVIARMVKPRMAGPEEAPAPMEGPAPAA